MFTYMLLLVLPLLASAAPARSGPDLPLDCEDVYNNGSLHSGVYSIYPSGPENEVKVYCDMGCDEVDSHKNGKWTVIQRRMDGTVNFFRRMVDYKKGFGYADGEYWLGLENMFLLTSANKFQLRVDLQDFEGGSAYAQYKTFIVQSESTNYKLQIGDYVNGGAGECLTYSSGREFYTFDRDVNNCANTYGGGFWYNACHLANPNGQYRWGPVATSYTGAMWSCWKGNNYSLKSIVMKIRRISVEELKV